MAGDIPGACNGWCGTCSRTPSSSRRKARKVEVRLERRQLATSRSSSPTTAPASRPEFLPPRLRPLPPARRHHHAHATANSASASPSAATWSKLHGGTVRRWPGRATASWSTTIPGGAAAVDRPSHPGRVAARPPRRRDVGGEPLRGEFGARPAGDPRPGGRRRAGRPRDDAPDPRALQRRGGDRRLRRGGDQPPRKMAAGRPPLGHRHARRGRLRAGAAGAASCRPSGGRDRPRRPPSPPSPAPRTGSAPCAPASRCTSPSRSTSRSWRRWWPAWRAGSGPARSARRQGEVGGGHPARRVGPQRHHDPPPGEEDVGMMPLRLGGLPSRSTKSSACRKSLKRYSFSSFRSSTTVHPGACRPAAAAPRP